jgi:hypothetical protein
MAVHNSSSIQTFFGLFAPPACFTMYLKVSEGVSSLVYVSSDVQYRGIHEREEMLQGANWTPSGNSQVSKSISDHTIPVCQTRK